MIRKVINIDEEKCNGCGLCAQACHEGAISIVTEKQSCCETITVTDWETVCPYARWTPSASLNARLRHTTKEQ